MASQFDNRNDILTRYNYERERRRRASQAQAMPQIMSAHEPVVNPNANINPFQDNFTPNTNTVSMQQIAAQVAPRFEQPLLERIGRGAANIPIGMAAMAEQATSDPAGFAKGTGEYLATWAQRLNPNPIAPSTIQARAEWGQQFATDPVGSTLDAAGVAGTALGLPALGGKMTALRNRVAPRVPEIIRKAVEPEVVPEVAQKPVISEPQQVPEIIRQAVEPSTPPVEKVQAPQTISEGVGQAVPEVGQKPIAPEMPKFRDFRVKQKAKNSATIYPNKVGAKFSDENLTEIKAWADRNGYLVRDVSPTQATIIDNTGKALDLSMVGSYGLKVEKQNSIANANKVSEMARKDKIKQLASANQTVAWAESVFGDNFANPTNKVALADFLEGKSKQFNGLVSPSWKDGAERLGVITPDGRGIDFPKLKKLYNSRAGKISPEPTATPDAAVRPAQPTAPTAKAKEPWEMTKAEWINDGNIIYHGSSDPDIKEFSTGKGKTADFLYATPDAETAKFYGSEKDGGRVYAIKHSIREDKIADLDDPATFEKLANEAIHDISTERANEKNLKGFLKQLYDEGYGKDKNVTKYFDDHTNHNDIPIDKYLSDEGWSLDEFIDFELGNDNIGFSTLDEMVAELPQQYEKLKRAYAERFPAIQPEVEAAREAYGSQEFYMKYQNDFMDAADKLGYEGVRLADPSSTGEATSFVVLPGGANKIHTHESIIERALKQGKPVPPEVLADYPDLAAKYGKQGGGSVELGAFGTPSVLHSTMGAVGRVAEKSMIPIQYIAKKIDGFMEKRGLANPLGTPEIVLKDTGIVEAFRDATAKEHAFVAEQSAKLREILGGRIKNERYLAEMFRHLDNPEAILNPTEKAMRGWFDEMLNTVNEFRIRRGEEPINYTEGYIPHIFKKSKELLDADHSIALPRKAQNRFANTRVGAEGYEKDLIQALELYTKATARDMYVNDALHASIPAIEAMSKNGSKILRREVITTPDGASKTVNFYNLNNADMWSKRGYAEAFVRAQLGLPTQGQRFFKQLGINPRTSQRVSNMATGLIYRNLLGMAIDTGIKNLSQVTHTIAENGMAPTLRGIGKFLTPEGIKTARAEHLLKEFDAFLLAEDMPAATRAKIFKQFDENVINGAMRFSEFVNRGIAYHTALDDAIKAGKSIADAHEIALKAVRGTQFEYNKLGTSPFMRGPLTRPAAQFMTFPVKTSEMLYRWANEGQTGRGKLLRYFATVGGLVYAGKEAGVELGNIFFDPTKTVDKDSKGGIALPLSGNKVKLDLSRLGTTGFAPQGAVPAVTKPYKYINDLIEKDRTAGQRVGQAAREFLPGGRFVGKAVDVATGSEYRDERGRLIRKDTPKDAFLKLFGGRSSNQESMNNRKTDIHDIEQEYYETRRKIIDTQLNGDVEEAKRMIADFSKKYPYLGSRLRKSLRQGRKDEKRKRQMSSDERFMDNSIRQQIERNL